MISPFSTPKTANITYREVKLTGVYDDFMKNIPMDEVFHSDIKGNALMNAILVLSMGLEATKI